MQVKSPFGKTQAALKEPSGDFDQATKKYVDESIVDHRNDTSVHLTLAQNTWLDGINATQAEVNYLSGVTSSVQGQLNTKLSLSGGTLTGALVLSANPTLNLGAATKQYVDVADAASKNRANHTGTQAISTITDLQNQLNLARGLAGSGASQDPNLTTDNIIVTNHANSPGGGVYWHITTTFYSGITNTSNRAQIAVQYNGGIAVYARSYFNPSWSAWTRLDQDTSKLPLAGGDMTGLLRTRYSTDTAASLTGVIGSSALQVMGDNTRGAWVTFNRSDNYAINLGLDTDNIFKLGGWSSGDGNVAFSCTGNGNFQVKSSIQFQSMPHNTNSGSAATVNFGTGQKQMLRLTAPCNVTFSFPGVGNYQLIIEQDGTGNRTLSYAQTIYFVGSATAPAINTGAWTQTILSVFWSGTAIYIAGAKVNAA